MKILKKSLTFITTISMLATLAACNTNTKNKNNDTLKEYNFEDISFKLNTDYKFEESDEQQSGTYSSKRASIKLDDNLKVFMHCDKYDNLSTPSEIINYYEELSDSISDIERENITINEIEMKNSKEICTRGVDPISCDYAESYYFVYEDKLYKIYTSSHIDVSKTDFTDDYKEDLFATEAFEELKKIVDTVETK